MHTSYRFLTRSPHSKTTVMMISGFEEGKLEWAEAALAALLREVSSGGGHRAALSSGGSRPRMCLSGRGLEAG